MLERGKRERDDRPCRRRYGVTASLSPVLPHLASRYVLSMATVHAGR